MGAQQMLINHARRSAAMLRQMADSFDKMPELLEAVTFTDPPNEPGFDRLHPLMRRTFLDLDEILSARETWTRDQVRSALTDILSIRHGAGADSVVQQYLARIKKGKEEDKQE